MKERILMLVFVIVCGTVLTAALVGVNSYTAPLIARNEELKLKRNIMAALHVPWEEATIEKTFAENVKAVEAGGFTFYHGASGDVAFAFEGSGLWGPIRGAISLDSSHQRIRDVTIMHQEETPGLGSRIAERSHLDKFKGRSVTPALVSVAPGRSTTANDVDAITGATMSSNAFIDLLNKNLHERLPALDGATQ